MAATPTVQTLISKTVVTPTVQTLVSKTPVTPVVPGLSTPTPKPSEEPVQTPKPFSRPPVQTARKSSPTYVDDDVEYFEDGVNSPTYLSKILSHAEQKPRDVFSWHFGVERVPFIQSDMKKDIKKDNVVLFITRKYGIAKSSSLFTTYCLHAASYEHSSCRLYTLLTNLVIVDSTPY